MRQRTTSSLAASVLLAMTTMSASAGNSGAAGLNGTGSKVIIPHTVTSISGTGEPPTAIGGTGEPPSAIGGTGSASTNALSGGSGEPTNSISGTGEPPSAIGGTGNASTNALSGGSGAPSTGGRPSSSVLAIGGTGLSQTSVSSHTVRSLSGAGTPRSASFNTIRSISDSSKLAGQADRPSDIRASADNGIAVSAVAGPFTTLEITGSGEPGNSVGAGITTEMPAGVSDGTSPLNSGTAIR